MCKECSKKLDLIDDLVECDVTNGRKIQKKLRKKLTKLGKKIDVLVSELKPVKALEE